MLSPRARGPIDLHLIVLLADLNVRVLRQIGHHLHRGKGGLSPGVGVKGGNPHQPVNAMLSPKIAVGIFPLDHNGGRLDPRLVRLLIVHDLIGKSLALGPTGVHAV